MQRVVGYGLGGALALLCVSAAHAHHSFGMFDRDNPRRISGVIKEFQWVNPHTWIQILVAEDDGVVEWSIEGRSPNVLARRGWTRNTLPSGEAVELTIYPHRDGGPVGAVVSITFADGRVLDADTPEAVDTNEEASR